MTFLEGLGYPPELMAKVQLAPIEDIFLSILQPLLEPHGIPVRATIEDEPQFPYVLVRRLAGLGSWKGDAKGFYDDADIAIHVFTMDPDGDAKGAVLSEIIRALLYEAGSTHWSDPDLGTLSKIEMTSEPSRKADWATSSGPVQYADLPSGGWRYETHYTVRIRSPRRP